MNSKPAPQVLKFDSLLGVDGFAVQGRVMVRESVKPNADRPVIQFTSLLK